MYFSFIKSLDMEAETEPLFVKFMKIQIGSYQSIDNR